jgi:hypothetical protein
MYVNSDGTVEKTRWNEGRKVENYDSENPGPDISRQLSTYKPGSTMEFK